MQYIVVHNVVIYPEARDMRRPDRIRYSGQLLDESEVEPERIMRWRDAGFIVPADAGVHLLNDFAAMSDDAKRALQTIGVFTLEQFLAGQGDFINEPMSVDAWLGMNNIPARDVERWKVLARESMREPVLMPLQAEG